MKSMSNASPAVLLRMLQDADPASDPRAWEKLKAGIDALLAENRDLAARNVRTELERDALFAAVGRQGIVYDADGGVIVAGPGDENRIARSLSGMQDAPLRYPDGRPVRPEDLPGHRALRGETLESCRFVIPDPGDEETHVTVSASPIVTGETISGAVVT